MLATGLATYPDAIVCGATERDPDKKTNITNPRVLVEVTSDSTEDYDRGEKLEHYKQIPTLEAVVTVSHREPRVEVWSKQVAGPTWSLNTARSGQMAHVPAAGCTLSVDAIWRAAAEPA